MSFESGLQAGLGISRNYVSQDANRRANATLAENKKQHAITNGRAERRLRQAELTAKYTKGINPDGSLTNLGEALQQQQLTQSQVATGANEQSLATQEMVKQLMQESEALKANIAQMEDSVVTQSLTKAIVKLTEGKYRDVDKIIQNTPALRERLQQIGIHDVQPVNWDKDKELYSEIPNLRIPPKAESVYGMENTDGSVIEDGSVEEQQATSLQQQLLTRQAQMDALDGTFFKAKNSEGKWEIHSTEELVKRSNTKQYVGEDTFSALQQRYMRYSALLKGVVLTDDDLKAEHESRDIKNTQTGALHNQLQELVAKGASDEDILKVINTTFGSKSTKVADKLEVIDAKAQSQKDVAKYKSELKFKEDNAKVEMVTKASKLYAEIKPRIKELVSKGEKLSDEEDTLLRKAERLNINKGKLSVGRKKNINDNFITIQASEIAVKKLKDYQAKGGETYIDNLADDFKSFFENGELSKKEEARIASLSAVNMVVVNFIKEISGTAVAESERRELVKLLKGGEKVTTRRMIQHMQEFHQRMTEKADSRIQTLESEDYYHTAYVNKRRLITAKLAMDKVLGNSNRTEDSNIKIPTKQTQEKQVGVSDFKHYRGDI